jgi:hypothetical protein
VMFAADKNAKGELVVTAVEAAAKK